MGWCLDLCSLSEMEILVKICGFYEVAHSDYLDVFFLDQSIQAHPNHSFPLQSLSFLRSPSWPW